MKTASADLFELIHLLSPAEKSYFKKFASAMNYGEKADYMQLFNAIDKQEKYDEEFLRKKFKKHAIGKNFSYNKLYLFNLILRTLKNYHQERNIDLTMYRLMEEIDILFVIGFYSYAKKHVRKLELLAKKYDHQIALLHCLRWKHALAQGGNVLASLKEAYDVNAEILSVIKDIQLTAEYSMLYNGLFYEGNVHFYTLQKNENKNFERLAKELFSHPVPPKSKPQLYYKYISCCLVYFNVKEDKEKIIFYYDEILKFYKENKLMAETQTSSYIINMGNSISAFTEYKLHTKAYSVLQQLKNSKVNGERDSALKWFLYYASLALVALRFGDFPIFKKEYQQAKLFMDNIDMYMRRKFYYNFHYDAACIFMLSAEYDLAITHINKLIESEIFHTLKNVQLPTYTLAVIIYYLKEEKRLFQYYLHIALRLFKKYDKLKTPDYTLLVFLKNDKPDKNKPLHIRFKELRKIMRNVPDEDQLRTLNYEAWIESIIQQTDYEKIMKTINKKGA